MQSLLRSAFELHAARLAVQGLSATWTYRDLDDLSSALGRALVARGARPGQILPILMGRSPLLVLAQVAALRIGASYSPIDLASPDARQRAMLDSIGSNLLLVGGDTGTSSASSNVSVFDLEDWYRDFNSWRNPNVDRTWLDAPAQTPAYVMFTSGSTGAPKGVMAPHAGIVRLVHEASHAHFSPEQRWAFLSSPAFDASTLEVWGPLLNGGCCVVQEENLPSLDTLADFLTEQRVSDAWLTSALFNAMVEDQLASLGGLQQLLVGGERVSQRHARLMLQAHPGVALINGYGPTENTTFTLCRKITLGDTESAAGVPVGIPVSGTQVRVEAIDAALPNQGELWAAGEGVAIGYLQEPELTERKFVWHEERRWYRTGDMVRQRVDGVFEFLGRVDRQIKLRGHRIELDEIEQTLANCPGIGQAAVIVRGNDVAGLHLAACYAGLSGAPPAINAVADHLAERLPAQAVPELLRPMKALPMTLNGKVDRDALARLLASEVLSVADGPATNAAVDFDDDNERALAAIWKELLPQGRIDGRTHFLRAGGSSLLALHVASLVRKRLRRALSPVDVLRHPVLSDQARAIARSESVNERPDERDDDDLVKGTKVPASRGQQNLLAATRLDPTGCAYLVHVALVVPRLDEVAWRAGFEQLVQRHPALRVLAYHDGAAARTSLLPGLPDGWWQDHGTATFDPPIDLAWPDELLDVVNRPLDTRTDGSMRVDIWKSADGSGLLVWTLHHHIIDEAGISNALTDLNGLMKGERLPPVYGSPFAFASFETALHDPQGTETCAAQLLDVFRGKTPPLESAPALGSERIFSLEPALQAQLMERCAGLGLTPFPVLLAAFGIALQEVFGAAFRFVSTPFSRRAEPELLEPVGYLLDLRFIEAGARATERLEETLSRVASATREAQAPSFQFFEDVTGLIRQSDADASDCAAQFAFTWRIDPSREIDIAGQSVRLLRAPQRGARYPICLHAAQLAGGIACSIEAVASAHEHGQVEAVWDAFVRQLERIAHSREILTPPDKAKDEGAAPMVNVADDALRLAWSRRLGVDIQSIRPESHFLRSGGSSLAAMRMAADLRRNSGLKLDVGAFLARPTFASFSRLARPDQPRRPDGYVLLGPSDFTQAMLLVPGAGGQAAGLYALADELQRGLAGRTAVAIVDLDSVLQGAPPEDALSYVSQRIVQMVRDLGQSRVMGLVGFSLGGSLALQVAEALSAGPELPIWMLDTFAPRAMRMGLLRKVERRLAWMMFGDPEASAEPVAEISSAPPQLPLRATEAQWAMLGDQLANANLAAPKSKVRLIQARTSVQRVGLIWQRDNNGFVPSQYGQWRVHVVDGDHLDIPRHLAATTAGIIMGRRRLDAGIAG